ncbi:MAG: DNA cytosine methyltransferase [Chloroflexota bacterium]|nr:DNA cytosine methyltransferase [Chloroflexota bacterium]
MSQDVTLIDFFCGAGGSSTGAKAAGVRVTGAANHWKLAIETHNTNHPETEHYLDDIQETHPSCYPNADIAWFSPSCTNHSLAKGRKRKNLAQLDLWGEHKIDPAEEKSRATMREVVEFTEYHRYQAVIVENVVDVRQWAYFDHWLQAMLNLGYDYRILYLNSQFFSVPQSRDRFYAVFWRTGNRAPDLDFRPHAACAVHGAVQAVQAWKKAKQWGRYGARRQYIYCCPRCGKEVQPAHVRAASVIDWSIPSELIGNRQRPLKPRTIERIMAGLKKFGYLDNLVSLGHWNAEDNSMVRSVDAPLNTLTARQETGLVQPFLTSQHDGRNPVRSVDDPLWCITGMNNEQQLVTPPGSFIVDMKNSYSPKCDYVLPPRHLNEPLTTIVASAQQHALLTPFVMSYYGTQPTYALADDPLPTMRTVSHEALVTPEQVLERTGFRMLQPHELKRGMGFAEAYVILGNKRDQVRQIGNAVTPPVAHALVERVVRSLI